MTTSMSHVDKIEIAEAFAKVEELSKACQNHLFENAVDLGKHELVIHALLNGIQEACSDWTTPLQSESENAASIQHLNTVKNTQVS